MFPPAVLIIATEVGCTHVQPHCSASWASDRTNLHFEPTATTRIASLAPVQAWPGRGQQGALRKPVSGRCFPANSGWLKAHGPWEVRAVSSALPEYEVYARRCATR